jgi:hypothetical protein
LSLFGAVGSPDRCFGSAEFCRATELSEQVANCEAFIFGKSQLPAFETREKRRLHLHLSSALIRRFFMPLIAWGSEHAQAMSRTCAALC